MWTNRDIQKSEQTRNNRDFVPLIFDLQGGACGHGLSFVDNFVKHSAGWLADTVDALLPSGVTGMFSFIVKKI